MRLAFEQKFASSTQNSGELANGAHLELEKLAAMAAAVAGNEPIGSARQSDTTLPDREQMRIASIVDTMQSTINTVAQLGQTIAETQRLALQPKRTNVVRDASGRIAGVVQVPEISQ